MTQEVSTTNKTSISTLSFEDAMKQLEAIVKRLESTDVKLEDAICDYETGNELMKHCRKKLEEAQLRIDKIIEKQDGSIALESADIS
jgi:exodeoxyribonuclease VII small subunit